MNLVDISNRSIGRIDVVTLVTVSRSIHISSNVGADASGDAGPLWSWIAVLNWNLFYRPRKDKRII